MKVHEIAKKLGTTSKEILAFLKKKDIAAKSHLSKLADDAVALLKKEFVVSDSKAEKKEKPKKTATASSNSSSKKKTSAAKEAKPKVSTPAASKHKKTKKEEPRKETRTKKIKAPASEVKETKPADIVQKTAAANARVLRLKFPVTVSGLATNLEIKTSVLIKTLLFDFKVFATVNQRLDEETCTKVAEKYKVTIEKIPDEEEKLFQEHEMEEDKAKLKFRPPVVTLMGHVDHGKTSLLDAIRDTHVVDREAGKITQHIGAYAVELPNKGQVTFLDTPGHSAFTAMRSRGANITDVVVLVVAADDGVMPQTIEAMDHAKAANTPIVVAINKSDLPGANAEKVKSELQKHDLVCEEWGGKTIMVKVSAKTHQGIDDLLEMLLLESEVMELKANPDRPAQGSVIEGKLSKSHGSLATILVQQGTLHPGDIVVCGRYMGKIRAMHNDKGKTVKAAGPSTPVEILGLNGVPDAGERFYVVEDEKQARAITEKRIFEIRQKALSGNAKHLSLESLYEQIRASGMKELKIILKADVQGSVEVMKQSLEKLSSEKIKVNVIHGAVGGINESDVVLAAASNAIIIGFHVKADAPAQRLIEKEEVDLKYYKIIYEAINEVKMAMEGLLDPTVKEVFLGHARIEQVFKASKIGNISGCTVTKGKLIRNQSIRLIRDNIVIYEGKLNSLKRFKDDAREVLEGYECGVVMSNYNDVKVGDIIECYKEEKVAAKL